MYPEVREAVRYAAERVPVAIVSGAAREEIDPVSRRRGSRALVRAIVAADDVADGKPHPEGYLRALELLGGGIRAGRGGRVRGHRGRRRLGEGGRDALRRRSRARSAPARLAGADELIPAIDLALVERLLA